MATEQIAILLTDRTTEEQVGVIEFNAAGMLGYHALKRGLHVFALKPIEQFLKQHGFDQPLYVKYAAQMNAQQELPAEVLELEATAYAQLIQQANPPPSVGGHPLAARVVRVTPRE